MKLQLCGLLRHAALLLGSMAIIDTATLQGLAASCRETDLQNLQMAETSAADLASTRGQD